MQLGAARRNGEEKETKNTPFPSCAWVHQGEGKGAIVTYRGRHGFQIHQIETSFRCAASSPLRISKRAFRHH